MFSGDNKCLRKISCTCSYFLLVLFCSLFLCLRCLPANAANLTVNSFAAQFTIGDTPNSWHTNIALNDWFAPSYLYNYEWKVNTVAFSGNYANIHFETNIVLAGSAGTQSTSVINGRFHNTDFLTVKYCGSSGSNFTIRSQNISNAKTSWYGSTPSPRTGSSNNLTLTVYGDVVVSGVPSGTTGELYCGVGLSNGWAFAAVTNSDLGQTLAAYFEQQPTSISFTTDNTEALQWEQINSIKSLNDGAQDRWQQDRSDEAAKEQELQNQADDLSLSTPVSGNPFTSWFFNNPYGSNVCVSLPKFSSLFNISPTAEVCSPYPGSIRNVLTVVSNMVLAGLIIRLYYKKLKGGVDG